LHPVFEEDEWKLVLVGGVLGIVLGVLQWIFLEPGMLDQPLLDSCLVNVVCCTGGPLDILKNVT
jgi:hypothetical protein